MDKIEDNGFITTILVYLWTCALPISGEFQFWFEEPNNEKLPNAIHCILTSLVINCKGISFCRYSDFLMQYKGCLKFSGSTRDNWIYQYLLITSKCKN